MKKVMILAAFAVASTGLFAQDGEKPKKKDKIAELTVVLGLSADQVGSLKKITNQKKKVMKEQKILIEAYEGHIRDAKQKSKDAKSEYEDALIEMLSVDQKQKYDTYMSQKKNKSEE